ncbi:site-2 protease family protein [Ferroplasma acidiphilum]|uniref:Peptidase n=1 Tax=Ferroplasma acidiphilum TaxID=74969 RepID=A0A7K4FQF5_9ARCH|nr:site-2 protease family protein [Ferroplasma acidiphilum]MCL4349647.1 peptidase [Candidatus Thermoplasmatota archaeon]NOL61175.1 peptidase [Ferroplasma acidiphilum]
MMYNRNNEGNDIIIAVIVLTIAFTLMINGGLRGVPDIKTLEIEVLIGFSVTVTAFLMHEMAHREVARRLGAVAFFKLWPVGILLALITSVFGFIFAAPGAVQFAGLYDRDSEGKIALAGPGTNIIIGVIAFLAVTFSGITGVASTILIWVAWLNLWFALFNLIPFPPLDGSKVFYWNSKIFAGIFLLAIILNIVDGFLPAILGI